MLDRSETIIHKTIVERIPDLSTLRRFSISPTSWDRIQDRLRLPPHRRTWMTPTIGNQEHHPALLIEVWRFGPSTAALQRHKSNDITALVKAADERLAVEDRLRGDKLHGQVRELAEKAVGILAEAQAAADLRAALVAAREARGCLELIAKLNGEQAMPAQLPCVRSLFALPASLLIGGQRWSGKGAKCSNRNNARSEK